MTFTRISEFLSWLGGVIVSWLNIPASWQPFTSALPLWAFGLAAVIVTILIFKIVTHAIFKFLMWAALIVAVLILASSLGVPIAAWFSGF
jgi:hypothetical protein